MLGSFPAATFDSDCLFFSSYLESVPPAPPGCQIATRGTVFARPSDIGTSFTCLLLVHCSRSLTIPSTNESINFGASVLRIPHSQASRFCGESESIRLDGMVDTFISIMLACFHMFSYDDGTVVEFWRKCWRKHSQQ
jgi:hypothetical protein